MLLSSFFANDSGHQQVSLADIASWVYGRSSASSGISVTRRTALTLGPWYRGLSLLAADAGKIPLFVYRTPSKGRFRDPTHPAYALLRRKANPRQTAFEFKQQIIGQAASCGNGYAFIQRREDASPVELWPLDPTTVTPYVIKGNLWYIVTDDGGESKIDHMDILHIRGFGEDGISGYDVIEKAREALGLGMAQRKYSSVFFRNSGVPNVVLQTPNAMTPKAVDEIGESWSRKQAGLDNQHRTAVLTHGLEAKVISFSAEQTQLIESMALSSREVALFLGIPPHKLGDGSVTTYNGRESENQDYLDQGLDHWLVRLEYECWDKLLTEEEKRTESHDVEAYRKALIKGNSTERSNYLRVALGGHPWMEINEARDEEGLNPSEGGDVIPAPLNMGNAGGGPGPTPGHPPGSAEDEEATPLLLERARKLTLRPPEPPASGKAIASLRTSLTATAGRMVRRVTSQARKQTSTPKRYGDWLAGMREEHAEVFRDSLASLADLAGHLRGKDVDGPGIATGLLESLHSRYTGLTDSFTPKMLAGAVEALSERLEGELPLSLVTTLLGE